MHGIRHDQARANKGVDLIESPRAPPTEARREHQGRSIDFPRVHHTDLLHVRRHWIQVTARRVQAHKTADAKIMNPVKGF